MLYFATKHALSCHSDKLLFYSLAVFEREINRPRNNINLV